MKHRVESGGRVVGPARLLALVWLLLAMLAMPVVATAQIVAARIGAEGSASRGIAPGNGTLDVSAARPTLRALPVTELRYLAERSEAKPLPAGPDPLWCAVPASLVLCSVASKPPFVRAFICAAPRASTPEARAPPTPDRA